MAAESYPTVDGLFLAAVEAFPDRPFVQQPSNTARPLVTYRDGARRVAQTVLALRELGLKPGDRLICYTEEIEPSIYFYLACASAGVIPIPFSPSFSLDAIKEAIEKAEARGIFTGSEPTVPGALKLPRDASLRFDEAMAILRQGAASHGPDDVFMFQPTSGTTGKSKYVVRTHAAFGRVAPILAFGPRHAEPQERCLFLFPLTHGGGLYVMCSALHFAGALVVPSRHGMASNLEEVRRLDPTYLLCAPRILRALAAQYERRDGESLFGPSMRTLINGGAAADIELFTLIQSQGVDVFDGLGASEYSVVAETERGDWRPGYLGKILPDVELKTAEDGELLAKTPVFMKEYYGDPGLTAKAYTSDGFFKTGDYCEITPDGYVRYCGRKTDLFNTFEGTNVHPGRIEAMLEELPWVRQAILIGDQKPFISAFLSVHDGGVGEGDDGFLSSEEHAELYARARRDVDAINATLEGVERIKELVLFAAPFPKAAYTEVGHAKVRRDRKAIDTLFAARIRAIYGE